MNLATILKDTTYQFIINVVIGLCTITISSVISIWIYKKQRTKKEISYEFISYAPIVDINRRVVGKVEVLYGEGENRQVVNEAMLFVLELKNSGDVAIDKKDFYKPLTFVFKGAEVLTARVLFTKPDRFIDKASDFFTIKNDTVTFGNFLFNKQRRLRFTVLVKNEPKGDIEQRGQLYGGEIVRYDEGKQPFRVKILPITYWTLAVCIVTAITVFLASFNGVLFAVYALLVSLLSAIVSIWILWGTLLKKMKNGIRIQL